MLGGHHCNKQLKPVRVINKIREIAISGPKWHSCDRRPDDVPKHISNLMRKQKN